MMKSKYNKDLVNILEMLRNIESDLNLLRYNETEKKIYHTIACKISSLGECNISNIVVDSGFSRSTVYKTLKKFEENNLIIFKQSKFDKREFNLILTN